MKNGEQMEYFWLYSCETDNFSKRIRFVQSYKKDVTLTFHIALITKLKTILKFLLESELQQVISALSQALSFSRICRNTSSCICTAALQDPGLSQAAFVPIELSENRCSLM